METLFFTLLLHSLRGGIVVFCILLIRFPFGRRIAPTVRHALWFFVIAALILPSWITIPVHESPVIRVLETPISIVQPDESPNPAADQPVNVIPTDDTNTMVFLEPPILEAPTETGSVVPVVTETNTGNPFLQWVRDHVFGLVCVTWGLGAGLLLFLSMRQVFRLSRRTKSRERIGDEHVLAVLERARHKMKIKKEVGLYRSDRIATPLLTGLLKPSILLPVDLCRKLTPGQLEHLFLHELAHLKRHDILVGWFLSFCCMIHWFNPLMWLMVRLANNDSEEAGDELALSRLSQSERIEYGRTLLEFVLLFHNAKVRKMPGFVGIFESPSKLSRRIEMVVQNKQCWKAGALIAVGLCAVVCMATLCRFEKTDAGEVATVSDSSALSESVTDNKTPVDLDKRVNLRGKAIGPDGKPDLPKGARLVVRALSADNEGNYFGDHTTVDTDGRFAYSAVCNLNYELVVYDNAGKWASKPFYLELGEEAPEKEIVIELVQGSLVEGTALSLETGEALAGTSLLFFRYFEVPSKTDGTPRSFPVTHFISADENGKFRVAVTPGTYGVATTSQAMKLFFKPKEGLPENIIQNSWDDETETPFTVFAVSQGETVKPILRISGETLSQEVNMEKRVDVRGKVVLPEEGELRGRTSIMVRALSADNKSNYFGSHTHVNEDGTFVYHAVCNLNYMMTVRDEFGEWASEPVWLEVGNESPQEDIVFTLVKGSVVEGTVLAQETGEPLSQVQLIFGQYFEAKTKPEGEKRISLVTDVFHTDSEGKFRKMVLPGEYGVATMSSAMSLFTVHDGFPENFFADNWDGNKKMDHTAFRVKENETVRPVLRLPEDSDDVQTPIPIHGKVFGPGGVIPEKLTVHVRALSAQNDTNMYASGGSYSDDGKILLMEPKNQNYMITIYDPANVWAAKPVMLEVGKEAPKDEFVLHLEKGKLIEGTLLDHATGRPIPNHDILFFEYFEVTSKRNGQTRTFPINSYGTTDAEGKFRRTVLPGKYGVCIYPASDSLFIPDMIKKATVTNVSDWQKNEQRPATAFQVSEKDEIVKPVLRITNQE